ncbi:MAG: COX15/CtaA family protein [Brumimicrobium sp.]|nr:COX15/CtaA family protein [Brumimicrobium sp.]
MSIQTDSLQKQKTVAYWLLIGVFMVIIQIIIGGVTRLTGSGLSITEWQPILGIIPPISEQDWLEAFEKYKGIAQFSKINYDYTLSDFKFIYFWEWFHRLWGRTLGVVFAIPFVYFIIKKYFTKEMIFPLVLLFILGGLQGLIGWIMVKSGLNDTNIYVSHIRLAIHFNTALILLVYTYWFALKLLIPKEDRITQPPLRWLLLSILGILVIQLFYGSFMAGLHAGAAAPSWPDINGKFIPNTFPSESWINDRLNVQFIHRMLAYILVILIIWMFMKLRTLMKENSSNLSLKRALVWPVVFVVLQVTLGIMAVLTSTTVVRGHFGTFEFIAELHQIVALFLVLSLVRMLYIVNKTAQ